MQLRREVDATERSTAFGQGYTDSVAANWLEVFSMGGY